MRVAVFGASGKVGQEVVAIALERGFEVVAFVHRHNPFVGEGRVTVITGDVSDHEVVGKAVQGSEAVISCLGSWGTKAKDVVSSGMRAITPAMEQAGVSRLVTVTGAGALWSGDRPGLLDKAGHVALGLIAPKVLRDGEEHLRLLEASALDWTAVRSPMMRTRDASGYRLGLKPPSLLARVPRAAVAQCLIDQISQTDYQRQAPFIQHT